MPSGSKDIFCSTPAETIAQLNFTNNWTAQQNLNGNLLALDPGDTSGFQASANGQISIRGQGQQVGLLDSVNDQYTLFSYVNNATSGPSFRLARQRGTPATNDDGGAVHFLINDLGSTLRDLARVSTQATSVASGSVSGHMRLEVAVTGSLQAVANVEAVGLWMGGGRKILTGNKSASNTATVGVELHETGRGFFTASGTNPLTVNRTTSDGLLIDLQRDGANVASITVASGVVTYGTFAGSHWSEWAGDEPPGGERTGLVVETTDASLPGHRQLPLVRAAAPASDRVYGVVAGRDDAGRLLIVGLGAFFALVRGPVRGGALLWASDEPGVAEAQPDRRSEAHTLGKVTIADDRTDVRLVPCVLMAG